MAHEVNQYDMTAHRNLEPWWYRYHPDRARIFHDPLNTAEFLELSGLDWPVIKRSFRVLPEPGDDWCEIKAENHRVTLRGDIRPEPLVLGTVSDKYVPLQNRDIFDAFNPMIEDGILEYETGGSLRNCRTVWVLCRYILDGTHEQLVEGERLCPYLLITTSHDGTGSVELKPTYVRVVCNNTLQMARNQGVSLKFTHTGDVAGRVKDASKGVAMAGKNMAQVRDLFRTMIGLRLDEDERAEFFRRILPDVIQPEKHERAQKTVELKREAWDRARHAPENDQIPTYRMDSLWACYQGVTRFASHFESGRVQDTAQYQIQGGAADLSRRALTEATKWVQEQTGELVEV